MANHVRFKLNRSGLLIHNRRRLWLYNPWSPPQRRRTSLQVAIITTSFNPLRNLYQPRKIWLKLWKMISSQKTMASPPCFYVFLRHSEIVFSISQRFMKQDSVMKISLVFKITLRFTCRYTSLSWLGFIKKWNTLLRQQTSCISLKVLTITNSRVEPEPLGIPNSPRVAACFLISKMSNHRTKV